MPFLILNFEFQMGVLLDGDVLAAVIVDDVTPDLLGDGRDVGARTGEDESVEVNSQLKKNTFLLSKLNQNSLEINLNQEILTIKLNCFQPKFQEYFPGI
jgi:hypothetical protein